MKPMVSEPTDGPALPRRQQADGR